MRPSNDSVHPHGDSDTSPGSARALPQPEAADALLLAAFASAAVGMALLDLDGRWLQVNDSLCRMLGYSHAELRSRTLGDVTHPADRDADRAHIRQLLDGDTPAYQQERRMLRRDGAEIVARMSVALVPASGGRPPLLLVQAQGITDEQRTEREREAWFRALYEQSPDAIMLIDPHHPSGRWPIVDCNAAACTMNGYARDELIGQSIDVLNEREDTPEGRVAYLARLRQVGRMEHETLHRRRDGTLFPIFISTSLVTLGGHEYVIGIDRDISVLKETEHALRLSEARYRTLVERLPAIIYTAKLDGTGSTTYVSPQIESLLGFTPEEWLASPALWLVHTHPDDRAAVLADMEHGYSSNAPRSIEYRAFRRDGRLVWLHDIWWVVRDDGGEPLFQQGITLDITARKQAEETARQSELRYRTIAHNFPNGAVFLVDHDLRYTLADGQALAEVGHSSESVEGKTVFEVLPPAAASAQAALFRAALAGERRVHEYTAGDKRFVTYYLPVRTDDGEIVAGLAVSHDITERSRAEEALIGERALLAQRVEERTRDLQVANAELARAAVMKDEFLASMSHELRTPLNAVLGYAESLRELSYGPLSERQHRAVKAIEDSGWHLLALINDILDVAKIGAGKIDLAFSQIRVEDVCDASLRMVRQAAQKKSVAVRTTIDPAVQVIEADVRRLKQILMNLLSNAVKFTPEGGEIGLEVEGDPERGVVRFGVWDTGIGIAADQMSRLFQPFVQIDSRLSRQYEGTGLGLVLVARLAELHGGSVAVESTPGAGSRFSVTLPWRAGDSAAREAVVADVLLDDVPQEPVATVRATSQTILLVDDTDVSARATADYLTAAGHRVIVAHSGEEALALASAVHLTMILTDIQMPSMDGLEVIQHLRRMPAHTATPIVALTALAMPGDRERCIAAGADDYLSKPIHLRHLRALIDRLHSRA